MAVKLGSLLQGKALDVFSSLGYQLHRIMNP